MRELESWLYKNSIFRNTEKTIVVSFHTRQNRNPLKPECPDNAFKPKIE
jgi:hypothetical protein